MWINTTEETDGWPLFSTSHAYVICLWLMSASTFRREGDSSWPCPWAYVFLWILSWLHKSSRSCAHWAAHYLPRKRHNLWTCFCVDVDHCFGPKPCALVLFGMIILFANAYQLLALFITFFEIMWLYAVMLTQDISFHSKLLKDSHPF